MKTSLAARVLLATFMVTTSLVTSAQEPVTPSPPTRDPVTVSDKVFEQVEVEPSVDMQEWRKHLEVHLMPVIEKAARRLKPGSYTVRVRFLVERDGSITDVKALDDPGHGLAAGAVKVVKSGPQWKPGEIDGRKVRSYHTQPITFVIAP